MDFLTRKGSLTTFSLMIPSCSKLLTFFTADQTSVHSGQKFKTRESLEFINNSLEFINN